MKFVFLICFLLTQIHILSQDFECNGAFYVIIYSESEGATKLYEIEEENEVFSFNQILLSENRRLTGLAYNTSDLRLWALDVDNFDMVRINRFGGIETMGKVENVDENLSFSSGMISPRGTDYYFLGYNEGEDSAVKFYELDLQKDVYVAEFDDISAGGSSRIQDMAVDPIFATVYGYNNLNGTIVQFGIDGQIATISQSRRDEQSIEALFFSKSSELYGYTPRGEMYEIDKIEGNLRFLQRGPQGTQVDGCACPYTFKFLKNVIPRKIIPCEPFDVRYEFLNHLGISQTSIKLRDTFPDGFEIMDISSSIAYTRLNPAPPKNILALENMIYLMGPNFIQVTILPPQDYFGFFSSQATQARFPAAISSIHMTDDPLSNESNDPTVAEIVNESSFDLATQVSFNCAGNLGFIEAPGTAKTYEWSNGSTEKSIEINTPGWYSLKMESDCFLFHDSIFIETFPDENIVSIGEDQSLVIGDSILLNAQLLSGTANSINWKENGVALDCDDCINLWLSPEIDSYISVVVEDSNGCILEDELLLEVTYQKEVYIPNIFSPNGDGINDTFFISSSIPGNANLFVYNRWGNLIYSKNNCPLSDESQGWDGRFNGEFIGNDTYVWFAEINYVNGESETKSGNVLLLSD